DTLAAPSDSVAAWVATVRRRLDAAAAPDAEFLTTSARLAHVLLPHEALEPSSTRRLLFSGDDLLAQFPLCALSVSPNRYEPLVTRCDVAWVRFHAPSAHEASGPPLVIVEPEYAPSVRRRYSVLQQPLSRAAIEAKHAAATLPQAVVLRGSEATKPAVVARAIVAPVVYIASHFVQDPEVPYVAFIPLAAPSPERADDSYFEISDIRGADLSKCRLVVL